MAAEFLLQIEIAEIIVHKGDEPDAVHMLRIRAHEVLPAPGHNVGVLAVGAKIPHDLQHGLVHHPRIRPVESRMDRRRHPVLNDFLERLHRHARVGQDNGFDVLQSELLHRVLVSRQDALKRLGRSPFRMPRCDRGQTVVGKQNLRVDRMFDPRGSILIEGGDAVLWSYELRTAPNGRANKLHDRVLGSTVIPGWQRVVVLGGSQARIVELAEVGK